MAIGKSIPLVDQSACCLDGLRTCPAGVAGGYAGLSRTVVPVVIFHEKNRHGRPVRNVAEPGCSNVAENAIDALEIPVKPVCLAPRPGRFSDLWNIPVPPHRDANPFSAVVL